MMMASFSMTYLIGLVLALLLVPAVIKLARKNQWVDIPNARSVHEQPIARLGGIAVFVSFLMAIAYTFTLNRAACESFQEQWIQTLALLLGSVIVFFVGLYDDLKGVRVRHKLLAQFVGAMILTLVGARVTHITAQDLFSIDLGWVSYPVTFLWIIGVTNAINLLDGLDGLAGGVSAIACGAFATLAIIQGNTVIAILMFGLFGALTGFLFFNSHPACIFMGDCGSLFLGFTIAGASVLTATTTHSLVGIAFPILVLGVPIFDTIFSMLRRFLERRGLTSPDRGHFHHRLLQRGLTQQQVAFVAYTITIVIACLGMLMLRTRGFESVLLFATCLILLMLVFRLVGAIRLTKTLHGIRDRSTLSRTQRIERKAFEEAQLHFKNAEGFDEWWCCMCIAAGAMDFASICLEIPARDGNSRMLQWNSDRYMKLEADLSTLHMNVPINDRRKEGNASFKVEIPIRESLEAAGRRIALFTRLADEHGLASI
jgi:UDP-GlcNAc:undecaprenyl-phosphate/decaprenyl-phosphate GlcNAc-1-phosphate transferase